MTNNLNSKVKRTATQWKVRAIRDRANRRRITIAQEFALDLLHYLELHDIKQEELAERMNETPDQINEILSARVDLSFEALDMIAGALDVSISSPKIEPY